MKIAIIGANSYIARNLIVRLRTLHPEASLLLYDRDAHHADHQPGYTSLDLLGDPPPSQPDLQCDLIYVFAGKTGAAVGFEDYDAFLTANERLLLSLLNRMVSCHSEARIIYPGTRLVYRGQDKPLPEDAEKSFHTVYAMTKYAAEQYLEMYHRAFGLRYTVFRICVPYGTLVEGATSYGTAEFMLRKAKEGNPITLFGDGSVRRTLTHIGDLCDLLIAGGFSPDLSNDIYNIGGEDYSLKEMAQLIASQYGVDVDFVPWPELERRIESGSTVFDDSKLKRALPVRYQTRFEDWVKEHG